MGVDFAGFAFGLLIAVITTPTGVSGAVFLLPVQLSILGVPTPAVTPTNLLYNVIAVPGALARYRRTEWHLARRLLLGTVPGVVVGAVIRVLVLPGPTAFRLVVAVFLAPLGIWLLVQRTPHLRSLSPTRISALGLVAGAIGGVYGIGGGSLLAPVLVGAGYAVAEVAPAALLATLVTSAAGAVTFTELDAAGKAHAAPHWALGLSCGLGGLIGGYLGATVQPHIPATVLRRLLGVLAFALAVTYLATA